MNAVFITKEDLANTKAEMIKWMFIFWVGQLAAMFGLLYFFIKKYCPLLFSPLQGCM